MKYKLKDILQEKGYIRGPFGSSLKRKELKSHGIPVYEQQHAIYANRDFRYYIDNDKYNEMKRFSVKPNDLIISCSGTVGKVDLISREDKIGIISQALLILRPNINIVLPQFLYYFFKSNYGYNSIVSRSIGSVQINIAKRDIIENIKINIPSMQEQMKIVKLLSDIDKKIEVNNQINKNLFEIQKCYFEKLFKGNSNYQIFKLDELCNISAGGDAPKEKSNLKSEKYNIPIISNSIDNDGIYGYTDKSKINTKSITISARGTIGFKVLRNYAYYPIVRLISLIPKTDIVSAEYIFYILDDISINSTGTTQQQLTVPMVKDLKIKIFKKELIEKFTMFSINLNNKIEKNKIESQNLKQLRDVLLPKLMNGEINLDKIKV